MLQTCLTEWPEELIKRQNRQKITKICRYNIYLTSTYDYNISVNWMIVIESIMIRTAQKSCWAGTTLLNQDNQGGWPGENLLHRVGPEVSAPTLRHPHRVLVCWHANMLFAQSTWPITLQSRSSLGSSQPCDHVPEVSLMWENDDGIFEEIRVLWCSCYMYHSKDFAINLI